MPFFILGNPRSGTSMFRLMLNAHTKITVPPESGFALWFADKYRNAQRYDDLLYRAFVADLFTAKKFETWELAPESVLELIVKEGPSSYPEMIELVYKAYALKSNKPSELYGDKNNYYIQHVNELIDIFPRTRLIFIIRDGRDVAVSYKQINEETIDSAYKPILPQTMEAMATEWVQNAKTLLHHLQDSELAMYIRYEDLLENPEATMTNVLEFLGLEYEAGVLEFYKNNDEPKDFLQWKSKTTAQIDAANKEKYKTALTPEEIADYERIAASTLDAFGYRL